MSQTITIQELQGRLAEGLPLQLVDVRAPGEFAAGHVPKAVNIPLEQIEGRLDDLGSETVAVICQSGIRAELARQAIWSHRQDVVVVEGGTSAWKAAGLPLIGVTKSTWALERQVRLVAGLLVLIGTLLSVFAGSGWVYLAMFVGAGLTFAGLTDICGMGILLAKLPWNQPASCSTTAEKTN
jgi:rhodanese-related sulfurtransferase